MNVSRSRIQSEERESRQSPAPVDEAHAAPTRLRRAFARVPLRFAIIALLIGCGGKASEPVQVAPHASEPIRQSETKREILPPKLLSEAKRRVDPVDDKADDKTNAKKPAGEIHASKSMTPANKEDGKGKPSEAKEGPHGIKFVRIEAGKFRRGSTPEQIQKVQKIWDKASDRLMKDELPAREIEITKPFEIGVTEVTQAQYRAVMGKMNARRKGDDLPMHDVVFEDADEFCKKLSKDTGETYRLPTEAEWEYACRAGSDGIWCCGDDDAEMGKYCWYDDTADEKGGMQPVGKLKPNAWGLYDMHGNVWEWCSDFYSETYYKEGPDKDPTGPKEGPGHVVRGGSAYDVGYKTRSAERDFGKDYPQVQNGFRIVHEIKAK